MPVPTRVSYDLLASQPRDRECGHVAKRAGAFPGFSRDLKPQHRRLHEPGSTLDVDTRSDLACNLCVLQSFDQRLVQHAAAFDSKLSQFGIGISKFADGADTHAALF